MRRSDGNLDRVTRRDDVERCRQSTGRVWFKQLEFNRQNVALKESRKRKVAGVSISLHQFVVLGIDVEFQRVSHQLLI